MYSENKKEIKEVQWYDNKPSSTILFRCRSNTLKLNCRNRFIGKSTGCVACESDYEDLQHFILYCTGYNHIRTKKQLFMQPYKEHWLAELLFSEEINKEEVKTILYEFWKQRQKLINTTT